MYLLRPVKISVYRFKSLTTCRNVIHTYMFIYSLKFCRSVYLFYYCNYLLRYSRMHEFNTHCDMLKYASHRKYR